MSHYTSSIYVHVKHVNKGIERLTHGSFGSSIGNLGISILSSDLLVHSVQLGGLCVNGES